MVLIGLSLPALSQYDPEIAGEGSLDPMGLAAISDRLADRLVPGVRSRMLRLRFVTAMAVGATVCESLQDVEPADGMSTPSICFEWIVVEAFARRLGSQMPNGVPGSQKAQGVIRRKERLSAETYLKGPSVFGFNGVYKPFAVDAGVVTPNLEPGAACAELTRAWERESGYDGFTDAVPGSIGAQFARDLQQQVHAALRNRRCSVNPGSWLFGKIAEALHPDQARAREREALRRLVLSDLHPTRAELGRLLKTYKDAEDESALLERLRSRASAELRAVLDAVDAYERFALLVDSAFRELCRVSAAHGSQPVTPHAMRRNETIIAAARDLPDRFARAIERMSVIGTESDLELALSDFGMPQSPVALVELLFEHHERVQSAKPPRGKRSWFEPVGEGRVVRLPYEQVSPRPLDGGYVHPVRIAALHRFVRESAW